MSVRHSNENLSSITSGATAVCSACKEQLGNVRPLAVTPCNHIYHKSCILAWLNDNAFCTVCTKPCTISQVSFPDECGDSLLNFDSTVKDNDSNVQLNIDNASITGTKPKPKGIRGKPTGSRPVTRSMNLSRSSVDRNRRNSSLNNQRVTFWDNQNGTNNRQSTNSSNLDQNHIVSIIQAEHDKMLQKMKTVMDSTIERRLEQHFRNLNIADSECGSNISDYHWPRDMPNLERSMDVNNLEGNNSNFPNQRDNHLNLNSRNSQMTNRTQGSIQPEKVCSLIQSWHLKFDGSKDGMSTDEFIYRAESLTKQILEGNFGLLCDNLHVLLTGKASSWFWKFHKRNQHFNWGTFCSELHRKFDDNLSDLDIWEKIRKRRQRDNENFEDYQTSIEDLVERLSSKVSESELVQILLRNSKTSLRYELLHFRIYSLSRLREEVRRHETFLSENTYSQNRPRNIRPNISVIDNTIYDDCISNEDISEIQHRSTKLRCWNCDSNDHRYESCPAPRKTFCYGCGAKGIYKSDCRNCNASENRQRDVATNT